MGQTEQRGKVQTVRGLIAPETLAATLMHEHVLCDITPPSLAALNDPGPEITLENVWAINYGKVRHATKYRLDLIDIAVHEVKQMVASGGSSVVELTCGGLKPDPTGLAEVSARSGANIVMGCGYYVEEYQDPRNAERSVDDFAAEMVGQVRDGAWGTDIRAGIIGEIGCQAPWTALEQRVMRGALIAQQETGAALNVHPGRHPDQPQQVADFIAAHDGDCGRTIISHIDRTIFDEGRLQPLVHFSQSDDLPARILLLVDASGSRDDAVLDPAREQADCVGGGARVGQIGEHRAHLGERAPGDQPRQGARRAAT